MKRHPGDLFKQGCLALLLLTAAFLPASAAAPLQTSPPSREGQAAQAGPGTRVAASTHPQEARRGYTLPPEKYEQAIAFARARYRLYFLRFAYGLLVLLALLRWRVAPKFRDWAERVSPYRLAQLVVYLPLLMLTLGVLRLPPLLYAQWLWLRYDQSVESWKSWLWDWTKAQLIGLGVGTILVWLLYGIIRRSPRRWWFYSWLASLPLLVFGVFVTPVVIEPLFFNFQPLVKTRPALAAQIDRVARRGGLVIPPERMFEMNASSKWNSVNAYVTGIGPSKRVVVWDTTIAKLSVPQILSVFGHEMGHYVLEHVPKGMAFSAGAILVGLYLAFRGLRWMLGRWGTRWAIRGTDDWGSLPVLLLLFSLLNFLSTPLVNAYSRHIEHQADVYALEVIHGIVPDAAEVAAAGFQKEGEIDLADPAPHPFIKFWLYSHPPLAERIDFARRYDPWSKGEPPQFIR